MVPEGVLCVWWFSYNIIARFAIIYLFGEVNGMCPIIINCSIIIIFVQRALLAEVARIRLV